MNFFDQATMFVAPILVGLLQCTYQGSDKSPFDTHPGTMKIAFGAFLVFYVAYTFSSTRFANGCKVPSGNVSVASLPSVFLPASIWPLLYAIGVALSELEFIYWLCKKSAEVSKEICTRYFSRVFDRFGATHSSQIA